MMGKIVLKDETGGQHDLQFFYDSYIGYIELSKYLFGGKNPYDINEMPKDNKFYKHARKIAKDFGISWKEMTHEESNRIMLALLEDSYNELAKVDSNKNVAIKIILKVVK